MWIHQQLNETDIDVLKKIGQSITPISPYEIQSSVEKSYNVIHKSVKKLLAYSLVELQVTQSEKSGIKTLYSLNFIGFCAYYSLLAEEIGQPATIIECVKAIQNHANLHEILKILSNYFTSISDTKSDANKLILIRILKRSTDEMSYIARECLLDEKITEYEGMLGDSLLFNFESDTHSDYHLIFIINIAENLYSGILNSEYTYEELDIAYSVLSSNEIFRCSFENYATSGILSSIELISGTLRYTPNNIRASLNDVDWNTLEFGVKAGISEL